MGVIIIQINCCFACDIRRVSVLCSRAEFQCWMLTNSHVWALSIHQIKRYHRCERGQIKHCHLDHLKETNKN